MSGMSAVLTFAAAAAIAGVALAAGLTFTAPPEWKSVPTTSSMRVAQFALSAGSGDGQEAELIVYYFGGSGGTVEANIARWLGQMQQPDGRASSAVATRDTRTTNGLRISLVDVRGTYVAEVAPGSGRRHNSPNFRLRAAVVETPNGPYFIKLTGPAATVAFHEKPFERFLSSLKWAG
jgi:hypothetical protein